MGSFPHCDELVLHAPGECKYCDDCPAAQQKRIKDGVNFTGHYDAAKKPCPAEERRDLKTINRWYGNRPEPLDLKPISAHEFTAAPQTTAHGLQFGIDTKSTAAALRRLADRIDAGTVTIESARVQMLAKRDDWVTTLLRMKFFERVPPQPQPQRVTPQFDAVAAHRADAANLWRGPFCDIAVELKPLGGLNG
jgi:hypothetical protein